MSTHNCHGFKQDFFFIFHHHPCENDWVSVFFECETLKAKNTAEEHIQKFIPKLAGWMQLVRIKTTF